MTVKKFTREEFGQWVENALETGELKRGMFGPLLGASPGGAAADLNVSRPQIHNMIKDGTLDAIKVYPGDDYEGQAREVYIREESLEAEMVRRGLKSEEDRLFNDDYTVRD